MRILAFLVALCSEAGGSPLFAEWDSHTCGLVRPDDYAFGGRLFRQRRLMPPAYRSTYRGWEPVEPGSRPASAQLKPPEEQLTKPLSTPSQNTLGAPEGQGAGVPTESVPWPTGVEWDKVSTKERVTIGGTVVTKPQGLRSIEGLPNGREDQVPDDGRWLRVTAIGAPAETRALTEDLQKDPKLLAFKNKYVLQLYDPTEAKTAWAVNRAGFVTDGHPSIYVQEASGKTLARLDHYPGPAGMATVLFASLRKIDPSYDPKKDPDPTNPLNLPLPAVVLGGCLLFLLLYGKRVGG
jgi:hypothetical protein